MSRDDLFDNIEITVYEPTVPKGHPNYQVTVKLHHVPTGLTAEGTHRSRTFAKDIALNNLSGEYEAAVRRALTRKAYL